MNDATKILVVFLVVIASIVGFALFGALILTLIAKIGGWSALARRYGATWAPSGSTHRFQSLRLGKTRYNNALTFVFSPAGFYISAWGPFRFAHPPLLIPWSDIYDVKAGKFLWAPYLQFEVGSPRLATASVNVSKSTLDSFNQYLPVDRRKDLSSR